MKKEMIVQLKDGVVRLIRPKAGIRNKALMKAESGEGIKQTTFLVELIPYCIAEHPWGAQPIREALDNLEVEDYDELIKAMGPMFSDEGDAAKKSSEPSGMSDTQTVQSSATQ
jgi:hypothetical protein